MGIREEQKEKRRQEILTVGLDLFVKRGYAATKITDIAEQVGMSVGLLFHYFKSKEKLYEELITIGVSGPMNYMPNEEIEPIIFFETAARQILQFIKEDPFVAKMFVLMSQVRYNEAAPTSVRELLQSFDIYTPTVRLIKKGQEEGSIKEGEPYALAIAYWCAIQGIAEQIASDSTLPCPESDWIVDMIRRKVS